MWFKLSPYELRLPKLLTLLQIENIRTAIIIFSYNRAAKIAQRFANAT
jgi:hypothetical protein